MEVPTIRTTKMSCSTSDVSTSEPLKSCHYLPHKSLAPLRWANLLNGPASTHTGQDTHIRNQTAWPMAILVSLKPQSFPCAVQNRPLSRFPFVAVLVWCVSSNQTATETRPVACVPSACTVLGPAYNYTHVHAPVVDLGGLVVSVLATQSSRVRSRPRSMDF